MVTQMVPGRRAVVGIVTVFVSCEGSFEEILKANLEELLKLNFKSFWS